MSQSPGGPSAAEQDDSRSSTSSLASPVPADNEESDFFVAGNNDSQSSLGVTNFHDIQIDDSCWVPVDGLPNEILIGIFSKLSTPADLFHCMLVSKRWARNAVDLLWHRPACTNWKNHGIICHTLGSSNPFFCYRDFVKRLNLSALGDKVNDGSVLPLAACSRVERLTLINCTGLNDSGLIALVNNNPNLLALDISNVRHITEKSMLALAQNCTRLQGLNITGCLNISNESMVAVAQNCRYIKRLKLNGCLQVRDDAVETFADRCPNILEIDLTQCDKIGNQPITSLMTKGRSLRELRLSGCNLIDDAAFMSLPMEIRYEHLRILDLTSCENLTDAAVQKIVLAAPRLRNLVLAKCRNITDISVQAIATLGKNLHYVHLGHCGQITDEGVKTLIQSCNRIRYIDLGCCTNLTDDSVKRLALLPKLKRIGLVKCSNITDKSVITLAETAYKARVRMNHNGIIVGGEYFASSLERVHLSYCVNLTLKSIMRLLNACPRLTHLSLTGVIAFQREEFQAYCRQAPPEFTPHQRAMFCVFSGNQVSKFRDFLNTSLRFAALRDSLRDDIRDGSRQFGFSHRAAHTINAHDDAGVEDDMVDDELEGDAGDGVDMPGAGTGQTHASTIGDSTTLSLPGGVAGLPPLTVTFPGYHAGLGHLSLQEPDLAGSHRSFMPYPQSAHTGQAHEPGPAHTEETGHLPPDTNRPASASTAMLHRVPDMIYDDDHQPQSGEDVNMAS